MDELHFTKLNSTKIFHFFHYLRITVTAALSSIPSLYPTLSTHPGPTAGIRPAMRPGVWQILVNHFTGRQKKPPVMVNTELTYDELCAANTDYHHAISIDLGKMYLVIFLNNRVIREGA